MPKLPCPRCGASSWLEGRGENLTQRCLCGLTRPLMQKVDGTITIMHTAVRDPEVSLPAVGTKIRKCLIAVHAAYPRSIMTGNVAQEAGLQNKETASLLITLMGRGFVERISERRGLAGGSEWKLTVTAQQILKSKE